MLPPEENPSDDLGQNDDTTSSAQQVNLLALAEEIVKLLKEEIRRENLRLGR
jgi:hypothetical protein